mmetsp:Transcript_13366/g.32166  ORF Transcript_13366/g.32166 Transcript_13366/m.32166 type:complete len:589 (-) Transcript_13366:2086-3852(-)
MTSIASSNSAPSVFTWSFGVGSLGASDDELSERFTLAQVPVPVLPSPKEELETLEQEESQQTRKEKPQRRESLELKELLIFLPQSPVAPSVQDGFNNNGSGTNVQFYPIKKRSLSLGSRYTSNKNNADGVHTAVQRSLSQYSKREPRTTRAERKLQIRNSFCQLDALHKSSLDEMKKQDSFASCGSLSFRLDGLEYDDDEPSEGFAMPREEVKEAMTLEQRKTPEVRKDKPKRKMSLELKELATSLRSSASPNSGVNSKTSCVDDSSPIKRSSRRKSLEHMRTAVQKVLSQHSSMLLPSIKQEPKMTRAERKSQLRASFSKLDAFNESSSLSMLEHQDSFGTMNTSATSCASWGSFSFNNNSWDCDTPEQDSNNDKTAPVPLLWPTKDDLMPPLGESKKKLKNKKKKSKRKSSKATRKSKDKSVDDVGDLKSKKKKRKSKSKSLKTSHKTAKAKAKNDNDSTTKKNKKKKKKRLKKANQLADAPGTSVNDLFQCTSAADIEHEEKQPSSFKSFEPFSPVRLGSKRLSDALSRRVTASEQQQQQQQLMNPLLFALVPFQMGACVSPISFASSVLVFHPDDSFSSPFEPL